MIRRIARWLLRVGFGPVMMIILIAGIGLITHDGWRWYSAKLYGEWNERSTAFYGLVGGMFILAGLLGLIIAFCDKTKEGLGSRGGEE